MLRIGDKVYFDSFSGLIRCYVSAIDGPDYHGITHLTLRVTARNHRGFKPGEKIVTTPIWAIERNRVYVRDGQYRIRPRIESETN